MDEATGAWRRYLTAIERRLRHRVAACERSPRAAVHGPVVPLLIGAWLTHCRRLLARQDELITQARAHGRALEQALSATRDELARLHVDLAGSRASAAQSSYLASHDSLTGLINRGHFVHQIDLSLSRRDGGSAGPVVFFIDLDHFKQINDAHGHAVGDEVLRIVAARLQRALRVDDLVARLGGDEFACLLHADASSAQLAGLAAKLLNAISACMKVGELQLQVQACIGLARAPADGLSSAELLGHADAAMYRAKHRSARGAVLIESGRMDGVLGASCCVAQD